MNPIYKAKHELKLAMDSLKELKSLESELLAKFIEE